MSKQKRYLNQRIEAYFVKLVLFSIIMLILMLVFFMIYAVHYTLYFIWIGLVVVFAIFCQKAYKNVVSPFKIQEKKLKSYHLGYDSSALSTLELYYSEHMEKTILKFIHLFDAMNAIKLTNTHAEYRALQNQINPHFLYNTLEAIRSDAICVGAEDIATITEALAKFFRYTISNVNNLVTLEEEIMNAENYFAIQNYRFGDKISLNIDYPETDSKISKLRIPKLTLQPIIENAIIHGLEKKVGKGKIEIEFTITEDRLLIVITDDGVGMEEGELDNIISKLNQINMDEASTQMPQRGGIALINVSNRLKLQYGEKYGLLLSSVKNFGTRVEIICPLSNQTGEHHA